MTGDEWVTDIITDEEKQVRLWREKGEKRLERKFGVVSGSIDRKSLFNPMAQQLKSWMRRRRVLFNLQSERTNMKL